MPESNMTRLLERSLERNRLAHAYLFSGDSLESLETIARTLAKALNCASAKDSAARTLRSCGKCDACRRIENNVHPNVLWVRPEMKSRVISVDEMRELMQTVNLKPTAAEFKVGVVVAADRLSPQAANAFLKTLEEPPPNSILILLTTEPQRILETVISRCLRLNFGGDAPPVRAKHAAWLAEFGALAARSEGGLLARYRLLGLLMKKLAAEKAEIQESLTARSPLEKYDDLEPDMRDRLEKELDAAIEAEYRGQRAEVIGAIQWWLRDVWMHTLAAGGGLLCFSYLQAAAETVAKRLSPAEAMRNLDQVDRLQRQLNTNVQEALALEVGLLRLKL
jgi:DNA polymerase-3 subunit delta'